MLQIIVVGKGAVKEIVTSFFPGDQSIPMLKLSVDPKVLAMKSHLGIFLSLTLCCSLASRRSTQNHAFCLFGTAVKFFIYPQVPESVTQFVGSCSTAVFECKL